MLGARDYLNYRRLGFFWIVAALSLRVSWALKGMVHIGQVYNDCSVLSIYDGDTMTVA